MFTKIKKSGTYIIFGATILVFSVSVPLNPHGLQQAEATTYRVEVVSDISETSLEQLEEQVTTAAENVRQTYFASWDNFKKKVLDPLFWNLADQLISNMLRSITQWINSGFEGSPAFVTDVEGFLQDSVDEAVGRFINESDELGFLCSPSALDVKLALDIQYQASKSFGTNQCTLTDVVGNLENFIAGNFSEGGWAGWFELAVSPTNDPNRAFLEGRTYAQILARNTRNREFGVLQANKFFLNVQACETVDTPQGPVEQCEDSTLGNMVQANFAKVTGAPIDRMTFADEFDELVGTLMGNFLNQMLTGVNGLLGMGGTSYASGGGYGSTGEMSYLEALGEEAANQTLNDSTDPIGEAIDLQFELISVLTQITDRIDAVEIELENAQMRYPSCFNVRMNSELTNMRQDAERQILIAEDTVDLLLQIDEELQNAQTPEERTQILTEFSDLSADLYAETTQDIGRAEHDLDYTLPPLIEEMENEIANEERQCRQRNSNTSSGGR